MIRTQSDSNLVWSTDRKFASPEELSAALLSFSTYVLKFAVGSEAAERYRHGQETVCDLIVGAIRMGTCPIRLFDSLDIP